MTRSLLLGPLALAGALLASGAAALGLPPGVRDLGAMRSTNDVSLSLVLEYRHPGELQALIDAQSDPKSPLYRRFLTTAQFDAWFAPSRDAIVRVVSFLERNGFRTIASRNGTVVTAVSSAKRVERVFGTELHRMLQPGHGVRYANVRPIILPPDVRGLVHAVVGFDSLAYATPDHLPFRGMRSAPGTIGGPLFGPDGGLGPVATATAYDFPVQHGSDGTGHAVGIAIDYDSSDKDLAAFTKEFDITRSGTVYHVPVDGGQKYDPSGSVESTLDSETAGSLAPGADIYVYNFGAAFTNQEILDAYTAIVSDDKVDVVNSSFGFCEDDAPQSWIDSVNQVTMQGVALGISFVASTGDFGRGGKCYNGTGQDVPAALTYFTAVGGTTLFVSSHAAYQKEYGWRFGGGGPSDIFPIPKYQRGIPFLYSKTKRNLPDIASSADFSPGHGDSFYLQGWAGPIGGTSWAAPTVAAFVAEANQLVGKRIGWLNPAFYAAWRGHGYSVYRDVRKGDNGLPAHAGFDDVTGIGSVRAFSLAGDL